MQYKAMGFSYIFMDVIGSISEYFNTKSIIYLNASSCIRFDANSNVSQDLEST